MAAAATDPVRFDGRMQVDDVCFTVTNPALGQSTLYGRRYVDGPGELLTPAIVLVHGIASSTANWDFSPTWSVRPRARREEGRRLLVRPAGLRRATTSSSRRRLRPHHLGPPRHAPRRRRREERRLLDDNGWRLLRTAGASTMQSRTVVIVGHSAGGWIIASYPGKYPRRRRDDPDGDHRLGGPSNPENDHGDDPGPRRAATSTPIPSTPTTSTSSTSAPTARRSIPARRRSSATPSTSPAPAVHPLRRSARSPDSARCTPRTTSTSA